jgi:methylenetetrahydrofolate dehydrogenase (NADP+) / methenyltetrahydrofolate cyclohydrolase
MPRRRSAPPGLARIQPVPSSLSPVQTQIIDGIALSKRMREALRGRVSALAERGIRPGLAAVEVGEHSAARVYVRNKIKACVEVGLYSEHIELPESTSEPELLARIGALNENPRIHGILVQLPLPRHIATAPVVLAVSPEKDVDGFHPLNVGCLASGNPRFVPCTPAGVLAMLEDARVNLWGLHAVMVGASNIVGKPMALSLLQRGATITVCNSKTRDLADHTARADILVVAVGKPKLVTGAMVKTGAVVIDVGISRFPDGRLAGDCDFASLLGVARLVTPVPGGVGPMTITMLLANTILAAERTAR